jgi:hypothetical protein
MDHFLQELSKLSPGTIAAIVALAGAFGAVVSAIVTSILGKLVISPFLGARDRQDREVEWRKHAIELTKLDLDGKLRSRDPLDHTPPRPSVLDFLANYRDLQELGAKTPKELYLDIQSKRISSNTFVVTPIALSDGAVGSVYQSTTLKATGGTPPVRWSVTPVLPVGLALDPASGTVSGTPTAALPKTVFKFTVTDSAVPAAISTATLTLEIRP